MPNFVHHTLTITGPEVVLDRFMADCCTEGQGLDFEKIIPQPESVLQDIERCSSHFNSVHGTGDLSPVATPEELKFPGWYEWRCANWGTKWNCYSVVVRNAEGIEIDFDTAWGVPVPILRALAERFPTLRMEGSFREEYCHFAGNIHISKGEVEFEDTTAEARAEWDRVMREMERESVDRFYADVLKFVAGVPNGISPGTIGEIKAKIAAQLVAEDPGLTSPNRREELISQVDTAYERGHVVSVTLSNKQVAMCRMLATDPKELPF